MNEHIFNEAEKHVRKVGNRDPFELLDYLRCKVIFSDRHPADGLKGFCTIQLKTRYAVINGNLEEYDQSMVGAHEAGHIVLHTSGNRLFTFQENVLCNNAGVMEREANLFAVDFSICDDDFMDCVETYCGDIFKTARDLNVPVEFLTFKIYSMMQRGFKLRMPIDMDNSFLKRDLHRKDRQ